ncbi:protein LOL5 [Elaeis guineensis]|uniref:Protein LOL2 isoform X1 n=1 Tax=Elaeis guineensis var. tenera TaxID=51953 RepID=A0A6I9QNM7_ELAGV|nr:protein LOL2 isoform X1 [Elaeis guineensis]
MGSSPEAVPPGWENLGPPPPPVSSAPPPPPSPEMGQMVCGSCRELLSYPRSAVYVQCPCCKTVNFVLEAHQVGNVKCGKCCMLLMYPYGAPSVRCSSCSFVTAIGAHNIRPPVSVQQGQLPPPQSPVQ